jgi:hypothetical protein
MRAARPRAWRASPSRLPRAAACCPRRRRNTLIVLAGLMQRCEPHPQQDSTRPLVAWPSPHNPWLGADRCACRPSPSSPHPSPLPAPCSAAYLAVHFPWPRRGSLMPLDLPWLVQAGQTRLHWLHHGLITRGAMQVSPARAGPHAAFPRSGPNHEPVVALLWASQCRHQPSRSSSSSARQLLRAAAALPGSLVGPHPLNRDFVPPAAVALPPGPP